MTPEGARSARSIRIVVEEQRYDQELLNQVVGVPWDEEGGGRGGEPSVVMPAEEDAPITPPDAATEECTSRRTLEFRRHGRTQSMRRRIAR